MILYRDLGTPEIIVTTIMPSLLHLLDDKDRKILFCKGRSYSLYLLPSRSLFLSLYYISFFLSRSPSFFSLCLFLYLPVSFSFPLYLSVFFSFIVCLSLCFHLSISLYTVYISFCISLRAHNRGRDRELTLFDSTQSDACTRAKSLPAPYIR